MSKEKLSGLLLIFAALFALILDNSPLAWLYDSLLTTHFSIQLGNIGLDKPLLLWINDGLMAIFFFLIGIEVKKEILFGELSNIKKAALPIVAALGGIIVPAAIYFGINQGNAYALQGWAIPVATDIAFALGILALVGTGLPKELKILLLSLAIIDDIAAILIIGAFYTENLSVDSLIISAIGVLLAVILNFKGVRNTAPYILIGVFIWVCVLKSGIHATLAGVIIALCIPQDKDKCPVKDLEHSLQPWVYFAIMPIFAFANSGINLSDFSISMISTTIPVGIIAGLFLGKQLGVFGFIWAGTKLGICKKPKIISWKQLYGIAILTGIGFTMSLFIGTLAFEKDIIEAKVRLGILIASLLSAVFGYMVLKLSIKKS